MPRNRRVFLSHTPEDAARCAPIVRALKDHSFKCWFETERYETEQRLSERTLRAIQECDVFLRICTSAAQRSGQMKLEAEAFRGLHAEDRRRREGERRLLVNVILDPGYVREPGSESDLTINATGKPLSAWMIALYRELGQIRATRQMSTRTLSIIVTIGIALALLATIYFAAHFNWVGFGTGSHLP